MNCWNKLLECVKQIFFYKDKETQEKITADLIHNQYFNNDEEIFENYIYNLEVVNNYNSDVDICTENLYDNI